MYFVRHFFFLFFSFISVELGSTETNIISVRSRIGHVRTGRLLLLPNEARVSNRPSVRRTKGPPSPWGRKRCKERELPRMGGVSCVFVGRYRFHGPLLGCCDYGLQLGYWAHFPGLSWSRPHVDGVLGPVHTKLILNWS